MKKLFGIIPIILIGLLYVSTVNALTHGSTTSNIVAAPPVEITADKFCIEGYMYLVINSSTGVAVTQMKTMVHVGKLGVIQLIGCTK